MASAPPDGRGGPHVFVDDVAVPVLGDDDAHHLTRVVRLRDGDALTVGDGEGRWRSCVLQASQLEPTGEIVEVEAPQPRLGVGFALIKGGRPELVVQKLTELGIDLIVPIECARSVVRWDEAKAAKQQVRLTRVAREAAMQSRQVRIPEVAAVEPFATAVARPGATLCERDGDAPTLDRPFVLVGPEGGWSAEERAADVARTRLSDSVLRAETAAIAVSSLLTALRSGVLGAR